MQSETTPSAPESHRPRRSGTPAQAGKADALRRLPRLKHRIAILTVLGFGALSGLAASNHVGATSHATSAAPAAPAASSATSGGGFFSQGGATTGGGNGYGFGSPGTQPPVASSGAS